MRAHEWPARILVQQVPSEEDAEPVVALLSAKHCVEVLAVLGDPHARQIHNPAPGAPGDFWEMFNDWTTGRFQMLLGAFGVNLTTIGVVGIARASLKLTTPENYPSWRADCDYIKESLSNFLDSVEVWCRSPLPELVLDCRSTAPSMWECFWAQRLSAAVSSVRLCLENLNDSYVNLGEIFSSGLNQTEILCIFKSSVRGFILTGHL